MRGDGALDRTGSDGARCGTEAFDSAAFDSAAFEGAMSPGVPHR